ncbi:lipase member H [Halyomorpha halys]|uniref:lipase member H n=1 Tax=Halyomorpha halys TaxID=286706 RepID=UPI0006D4EC3A|nr:lipase member H-like [Halyomorpha halys]
MTMIRLLTVLSLRYVVACYEEKFEYSQQESPFQLTADSVRFLFFNSSGIGEPHAVTDPKELTAEDYDNRKKTIILIHGFADYYPGSFMIPLLLEAYSKIGNRNIIAVEWGKLAAAPFYISASKNTYPVGKILAKFLRSMIKHKSHSMYLTEFIGFSLGAHVAGVASNFLRHKPRRIIGLDPAEPLFADSPLEYCLDKDDAPLVEVIHTSGGFLGFRRPIGHRDFYPNGGLHPQPGCPGDIAGICSHRRGYRYFADAVKNRGRGFKATKCDSMKDYIDGKCSGNPKLLMYNNNFNPALNGSFYLVTNPQKPFGRIQ